LTPDDNNFNQLILFSLFQLAQLNKIHMFIWIRSWGLDRAILQIALACFLAFQRHHFFGDYSVAKY
jgi:hypothetical protein